MIDKMQWYVDRQSRWDVMKGVWELRGIIGTTGYQIRMCSQQNKEGTYSKKMILVSYDLTLDAFCI